MSAVRVSVTDVDSWLYFSEHEDASLEALLAQLRKQAPQTEAMRVGGALHKALETSSPGTVNVLEADGYRFDIAADAVIELPEIREIKAEMQFPIDLHTVTLVGKVDAIHGHRVEDHKTTRNFEAENYLSGFQWRAYLVMFRASCFRWNVFEIDEQGPGVYRIKALHKLEQYRYAGMEDHVRAMLTEFVVFAEANLPERFLESSCPSR